MNWYCVYKSQEEEFILTEIPQQQVLAGTEFRTCNILLLNHYLVSATGIFKLHNKYFLPHDDVMCWEFRLHSGAVNLFLSPELLSAHLGLGLGRFLRQTKQTPWKNYDGFLLHF